MRVEVKVAAIIVGAVVAGCVTGLATQGDERSDEVDPAAVIEAAQACVGEARYAALTEEQVSAVEIMAQQAASVDSFGPDGQWSDAREFCSELRTAATE